MSHYHHYRYVTVIQGALFVIGSVNIFVDSITLICVRHASNQACYSMSAVSRPSRRLAAHIQILYGLSRAFYRPERLSLMGSISYHARSPSILMHVLLILLVGVQTFIACYTHFNCCCHNAT